MALGAGSGAALLALGCSRGSTEQAKAPPPPVPVVMQEVRVSDVPVFGEFTGRLEACQTIDVSARVEGVLIKRLFEEGDEVAEGQVIFEIDDRPFAARLKESQAALAKATADLRLAREQVQVRAAEASVVQAQAQLARARADEARLRPLAEIDAVPRQDLDNAIAYTQVMQAELDAREATLENTRLSTEIEIARGEAAVAAAAADLDMANINLGYCTIAAPTTGRIGKTSIDVGNLVGRPDSSLLATIRVIDPIDVSFAISEADYLRFVNTDGGTPEVPSLTLILADGSTWREVGELRFAERVIDIRTGTMTIRGRFPNPEDVLRPGMFGRIRAEVRELPKAILVPRRAVMQRQTARFVYVVGDDGVVKQRGVTLGPEQGGDVVIASGLEPGERIIVEGLQKVAPGSRVVPAEPTSAEPAPATAPDEAARG